MISKGQCSFWFRWVSATQHSALSMGVALKEMKCGFEAVLLENSHICHGNMVGTRLGPRPTKAAMEKNLWGMAFVGFVGQRIMMMRFGHHHSRHRTCHVFKHAMMSTAADILEMPRVPVRPVHISSMFDAGNIVYDSSNENIVNLRIKPDPYCATDGRSHMQWFYFRASNVKDRKLIFQIINAGEASFPSAWKGFKVYHSYDLVEWPQQATTQPQTRTYLISMHH
eukprot:GGOE01003482.1.p1 GENE.GGOE01003482.1~~GGOE01003482.1.p1  ORF type:complete len:225 (-),score=18.15 GGOE01003482.1:6-680(-)